MMKPAKKVIIPVAIIFISFVIFLQLDIALSRTFITTFKKATNIQLQCKNLYSAPISVYGKIENEEKATFFDSLNKQKTPLEACILDAFAENASDHKMVIAEANIVLDKIKKVSLEEVKLLGSYRENQIVCHVVNNGDKAWKNINVQLYGYFDTKSGYKMLEDETLATILNSSVEELMMEVSILEPGEILNRKNFEVNREQLGTLSGILNIGYKTFKQDKKTEIDRGLLGRINVENTTMQFSVGEETLPEPAKGGNVVDVQNNKMQRIAIDKEFNIKPREQKLLQSIIYPTQSCEVEAYLEVITKEGKTKKTKAVTQKILVPKYKTNYGLYTEVRNWIAANAITNYKYGENAELQAGIVYQATIPE